MTNEEALDELNVIYERLSHPEDCEQGVYSFRDGDYLEALDMAIKALEQQPCEDCISRAELLKAIDTWDKFGCDANTKLVPYQDHYVPYIHYDDVVKCIKGMPSVTPQPFINKKCVAHQVCHDDKVKVLDKIRDEILDEAEYAYADFEGYKEDILYVDSDELPDDDFRYGMERAVEIINKYKAENEKEEPAEWIVDTDDSRRWDRVRYYCSACNGWNTYGKSKYCPNCGRRMQSEGLQREDS